MRALYRMERCDLTIGPGIQECLQNLVWNGCHSTHFQEWSLY